MTIGEGTKQHQALLPILKEVIEMSAGFDVAEAFPSIKLLQVVSGLRRRVRDLHREADRILEDVIDQHRDGRSDRHEDLLDVLLKFQEDELEIPLTTDNIKAVIVVSFFFICFSLHSYLFLMGLQLFV